jgi:multiple sugar transport system substrate-binding protein
MKRLFALLSVVMIFGLLTACAAPTPQVIEVTKEVEKVVTQVVPTVVKETVVVEKVVTPTPAPVEELPYGLKPGKPYAGQTITVLITGIVPQYQWLINKSPEFTEMTGIEVKYETVPWASLVEKITTDGVAQAGAFDLYPYMDAWGPSISRFLLPLDDRIKEAGIDWNDFVPAHRAGACYSDGHCYGIPLRGHPQLLFYRKDVFDQLGLKVPTTFQELEEVSKVIQDKTDLYGFSICYGAGFGNQNLMTWIPFLWGNGSDIFDENWKPIFNNDAGVEATQRHVDLLLKHHIVPPASVTWGEAAMANSVRQGESAMMISWWWLLQTFSDPKLTAEDVLGKVSFASPPGWEGKKTVPYTLSMPIGINRFSKHPDAAWEYIKMMTSAEAEKMRVIE